MSHWQEYTTLNEGTGNQDYSVGTSDNNLMTNENTVNLKTLKRCFHKKIDLERSKIVDTVKDRF